MGLMDNIKSWLNGTQPEQQDQDVETDYVPPDPPAVTEMPKRPEPQAPAAQTEPEERRPHQRMRDADYKLEAPYAAEMAGAAERREAEPGGGAEAETPAVEEPEGRYGELRLDTPDQVPEQPGQWIPRPAGPGGSGGYMWQPAPEGPNNDPGPQPEPEPEPDHGPAVDQLQFFEDVNPDHDVDGMDL